ncbi:MAG: heme A synthase [Pseudomonadota bacterium]
MAERSIFEEVDGAKSAAPKPQGGVIERAGSGTRAGARAFVRAWLSVLFFLVVAIVVVGGLTRLTDSGLSITEWEPLRGAIPPLSAADWQAEFDAYRQIPEYQLQNRGMSLSEFQFIYWWEWGHRQLGRVIGLVWAVGFFGLLVSRKMPPGWTGRLFLIGALGGLQGAIGWWMVSSGLEGTMLDVASYRLATHLGLAFIILGFITWFILSFRRSEADLIQFRRNRERRLFGLATALLAFAFVQILLGALVAGIDAGQAFATWPLMGGGFFPPGAFDLEPLWRNFFENAGLVQFMHRMASYLLFAFGIFVWWQGRGSGTRAVRTAFHAMFAMMLIQVVIGIMTLVHAAPLQMAILHQFGAVILWVLILRARFLSAYPPSQSVRA